ncbi:MAG: hypothetical protein QOK07_637 [Gemmatimonadaceae bacterium]|nr:hypothetical protein [Gemmatimonadaceae bacterium]
MSVSRMLRLSLVPVFAMACGSDTLAPPIRSFVHAAAVAECGPADGPAVAIYLSPNPVESIEPSGPFVRVYVPVQLDQLTGQVWQIVSISSIAGAWFHPNASTSELADTGYLMVTSIGSDNTVTGSIDLRFPTAGHIRSSFQAKWLPRTSVCV